ncbi:MAG TPA: hypothetical protein DCG49_10850 [Ruminococcus sp.]|nr:hypothetical protein [Ruminococcus sp.]
MKSRFFAVFGILLLSGGLLSACANNDAAEEEPIETEDMPYGATITCDTDLPIAIQYDNRFMDQDLAEKVVSLHESIQEKDPEQFTATLFPMYHEYEMEYFYNGKYTDAEILENSYASFQGFFGGEFDFSMLDVTNVVKEDVLSPTRDTMQKMLDDLASDRGESPVSEETDAFVELTITRYLTQKGSGEKCETDKSLPDETIYALHYQGEWYLILV